MIDINRVLEELICSIPKGKVTTFKVLAEALGSKYAIKFVLQNYRKIEGPWWRVVNERGIIKDPIQKKILKEEGIEINGDEIVGLERYLFKDFKIEDKPLEKLRRIQIEITKKLILYDDFDKLESIGGVDLSYKGDSAKVVYVVLDKNLSIKKKYVFIEKVNFPYIPSFLAFREGEPIIKTFDRIDEEIDILFVNGVGIAHPVRVGLATWVGYQLNIPTIGITKSLLYGKLVNDRIVDEKTKEVLGYVIRKFGREVYVSPGYRVSLNTSKQLSEKFWIRGRYPEPIRLADEISKKVIL